LSTEAGWLYVAFARRSGSPRRDVAPSGPTSWTSWVAPPGHEAYPRSVVRRQLVPEGARDPAGSTTGSVPHSAASRSTGSRCDPAGAGVLGGIAVAGVGSRGGHVNRGTRVRRIDWRWGPNPAPRPSAARTSLVSGPPPFVGTVLGGVLEAIAVSPHRSASHGPHGSASATPRVVSSPARAWYRERRQRGEGRDRAGSGPTLGRRNPLNAGASERTSCAVTAQRRT
jgi:hypothetical protein